MEKTCGMKISNQIIWTKHLALCKGEGQRQRLRTSYPQTERHSYETHLFHDFRARMSRRFSRLAFILESGPVTWFVRNCSEFSGTMRWFWTICCCCTIKAGMLSIDDISQVWLSDWGSYLVILTAFPWCSLLLQAWLLSATTFTDGAAAMTCVYCLIVSIPCHLCR